MTDEPKCLAFIEFGDDVGDNTCTMHCQLARGHVGNHVEAGHMDGKSYTVTWSGADETLGKARR